MHLLRTTTYLLQLACLCAPLLATNAPPAPSIAYGVLVGGHCICGTPEPEFTAPPAAPSPPCASPGDAVPSHAAVYVFQHRVVYDGGRRCELECAHHACRFCVRPRPDRACAYIPLGRRCRFAHTASNAHSCLSPRHSILLDMQYAAAAQAQPLPPARPQMHPHPHPHPHHSPEPHPKPRTHAHAPASAHRGYELAMGQHSDGYVVMYEPNDGYESHTAGRQIREEGV